MKVPHLITLSNVTCLGQQVVRLIDAKDKLQSVGTGSLIGVRSPENRSCIMSKWMCIFNLHFCIVYLKFEMEFLNWICKGNKVVEEDLTSINILALYINSTLAVLYTHLPYN